MKTALPRWLFAITSLVAVRAFAAPESDWSDYLTIEDPRAAAVIYAHVPALVAAAPKTTAPYKMHEFLVEDLVKAPLASANQANEAKRRAALEKDAAVGRGPLRLRGKAIVTLGDPSEASGRVEFPVVTKPDDAGIPGAAIARLCVRKAPAERPQGEGYVVSSSEQLPFKASIYVQSDTAGLNYVRKHSVATLPVMLVTGKGSQLPQRIAVNDKLAKAFLEQTPRGRAGREVEVEYFIEATGLFPSSREGYFQYPVFEIRRAVYRDKQGAILCDETLPRSGFVPVPAWAKK